MHDRQLLAPLRRSWASNPIGVPWPWPQFGQTKPFGHRNWVVDQTDKGPERRYVITNLKHVSPEMIYSAVYCKRGRAEQFIKELKSFKCTRLSCQEFWANQFRLLMHGLAYLLVLQLRNLLPKPWRTASVVAVRNCFLKVAAQIEETKRRIEIRWAGGFRSKSTFFFLCKRLDSLPVISS